MSVVALDSRRATLGGSTLPAACGIDPWCSPIRLWLEMTQGLEREETEGMRWGRRLEPVIFDALCDEGYDVIRTPHADLTGEVPWIVGHPDGQQLDTGGVVEAKATAHGYAELPAHWEAQLQTYLHLADAGEGIVAQLAGLHLTVWEVERKPHVAELLLALGEVFVGHVRSGTVPPPDSHPDDRAALLAVYPDAVSAKIVRETRGVRDARRELAEHLSREKAWKARVEHLRAVMTAHMGDAEVLVSSHDEPVATWKTVTSRRLDSARFRKERPELYDLFASETTTRRLLV